MISKKGGFSFEKQTFVTPQDTLLEVDEFSRA